MSDCSCSFDLQRIGSAECGGCCVVDGGLMGGKRDPSMGGDRAPVQQQEEWRVKVLGTIRMFVAQREWGMMEGSGGLDQSKVKAWGKDPEVPKAAVAVAVIPLFWGCWLGCRSSPNTPCKLEGKKAKETTATARRRR